MLPDQRERFRRRCKNGAFEDAAQTWAKGAQAEKGDEEGEPAVPYHDVEPGLQREEPFPARGRVAVVVGAEG